MKDPLVFSEREEAYKKFFEPPNKGRIAIVADTDEFNYIIKKYGSKIKDFDQSVAFVQSPEKFQNPKEIDLLYITNSPHTFIYIVKGIVNDESNNILLFKDKKLGEIEYKLCEKDTCFNEPEGYFKHFNDLVKKKYTDLIY